MVPAAAPRVPKAMSIAESRLLGIRPVTFMPPTVDSAAIELPERRPAGRVSTGSSFGCELHVEEAERELVVADQVDELLRLLDLGQVAAVLRPDRASAGGT